MSIERVIISIHWSRDRKEVETELLSATAGISSVDLDELMDWARALKGTGDSSFGEDAPSLENGWKLSPFNLCYFTLPSGAVAIGQLTPDFSEKRNLKTFFDRLWLRYIVVDTKTMSAFGWNPISLFQTALNNGQLNYHQDDEKDLAPIEIPLPTEIRLDRALLKGLAVAPGIESIVILLQSILDSIVTHCQGQHAAVPLIGGLFELLPIYWRSELSFSVGLDFGGEHFCRLIFHPGSTDKKNEESRETGLPFLNLDQIEIGKDRREVVEGWPLFVRRILETGQYRFFFRKLQYAEESRKQDGVDALDEILKTEEVNQSGFEWLYELQYLLIQYRKFREKAATPRPEEPLADSVTENGELLLDELLFLIEEEALNEQALSGIIMPDTFDSPQLQLNWDGKSTPRLETNRTYPGGPKKEIEYEQPLFTYGKKNTIVSPYQRLLAQYPEHRDSFLQLDGLIAQLIKADAPTLAELELLWSRLDPALSQEESWAIREEYVHYLQLLLSQNESEGTEDPLRRNVRILGIINLLLEGF